MGDDLEDYISDEVLSHGTGFYEFLKLTDDQVNALQDADKFELEDWDVIDTWGWAGTESGRDEHAYENPYKEVEFTMIIDGKRRSFTAREDKKGQLHFSETRGK